MQSGVVSVTFSVINVVYSDPVDNGSVDKVLSIAVVVIGTSVRNVEADENVTEGNVAFVSLPSFVPPADIVEGVNSLE